MILIIARNPDVAAVQCEESFFNALTQEQRNQRLLEAAEYGEYHRVEWLIYADADLDHKDDGGETALHKAAYNDHHDCVGLLLQRGAHVNSQDAKGCTALSIATKEGHCTVCRVLIENGANVNICDFAGVSALHFASGEGNIAIAKLLLQNGANIEAINDRGEDAFSFAARLRHEEILKLLLSRGASIKAGHLAGNTALISATEIGQGAVGNLLPDTGSSSTISVNDAKCEKGMVNLIGGGTSMNANSWGCQETSRIGERELLENDENLIIGIDFGMKFSSLAYVFEDIGRPGPTLIDLWPSLQGLRCPNVPNCMEYDSTGRGTFKWGYGVQRDSKRKLEGIRFLLAPDQPLPLLMWAHDTRRELLRLGKDPFDVASDYIGALYQHVLDQVNQCFPREYVEAHQKKCVITIPTAWSEKAKQNLRKVCYHFLAPLR